MNIYETLGIDHSADERAIKRAYAGKVKQFRPETHPAEFAAIREAYEEALYLWRHNAQWDEPQEAEDATPESEASPAAEVTELQSAAQPELAPALVESAAPAQPARNINDDMMDVLADQPGEEAALQEYHKQALALQQMPLDLQMDYEQALSYWLLFSATPSLLVFAEANKRYAWSANSLEIMRLYGNDAGARFSVLLRLSELLQSARERPNSFLALDGVRQKALPVISGHHDIIEARRIVAEWESVCETSGYPSLKPRLQVAPERKFQVYLLDVEIGLFWGWLDWLIESVKPDSWVWPDVLLTFVLFASLPALGRMLKRWAGKKVSRPMEWYRQHPRRNTFALIAGFILLLLVLPKDASLVLISAFAAVSIGLLVYKAYGLFASAEADAYKKMSGLRNYLMRPFRPQYRMDEHGQLHTLRWNSELLAWLKNSREKWRNVRLSTYWWIVIWIIVMQLMSNLLKK